ncbi:MAG: complex I NDUFA9 subunit family protein [Betaproteobacteria bacterium]|nr:complex I NDUFA9 subunit family protein [Betaproteobacteria bacterium]
MKNIFVLGGSGFVGAHVCEQLVRAGWQITVPTRRRRHAQGIQHLPGLTVLEMDVHDEAALTRAMAGHSAVLNLVAILHGDAAAFARTHVQLAEKISRACAVNGVSELVQISALGADPARAETAPSHYLRSKSAAEAVLVRASAAQTGLRVSVLRPSVIFGSNDQFMNVFAKLQAIFPFIPLAGADARFQPVWDVAQAVVRVLSVPPGSGGVHTWELVGPDVLRLRDLVHMAGVFSGAGAGKGRPIVGLPMWVARIQAFVMELAPGAPVMSRDNLDSMRVDNVATPGMPGLAELGIRAAALEPVARAYLRR